MPVNKETNPNHYSVDQKILKINTYVISVSQKDNSYLPWISSNSISVVMT